MKWHIEIRAGIPVVVGEAWCRPATDAEWDIWRMWTTLREWLLAEDVNPDDCNGWAVQVRETLNKMAELEREEGGR